MFTYSKLLGPTLLLAVAIVLPAAVQAGEISGDYLEIRTCDIYTGPCFANAELGITGRQALLAWSIDQGQHLGVDLSGLKVVLAIRASDTLGYGGGVVCHPDPITSAVIVDERGSVEQRDALVDFVKQRAKKVVGETVQVEAQPIEMELDHIHMVGKLSAGKQVNVLTRKLAKGDCVCTNEVVYYPPLTKVDNFAPAYTLDGRYSGRALGVRWSTPMTRSSFLATFDY